MNSVREYVLSLAGMADHHRAAAREAVKEMYAERGLGGILYVIDHVAGVASGDEEPFSQDETLFIAGCAMVPLIEALIALRDDGTIKELECAP